MLRSRLEQVLVLVEEIGMFGSIGTNLCGLVLMANWCLWIGEFQLWWIDAWIVACDHEWRERVSVGEWRKRAQINNKKK